MNLHQIQNLCIAKESISAMKKKPWGWRDVSASKGACQTEFNPRTHMVEKENQLLQLILIII